MLLDLPRPDAMRAIIEPAEPARAILSEPRNAKGLTYAEIRAAYEGTGYPVHNRDKSARGAFDEGRLTLPELKGWLANAYPAAPVATAPVAKPELKPLPPLTVTPVLNAAPVLRAAPSTPVVVTSQTAGTVQIAERPKLLDVPRQLAVGAAPGPTTLTLTTVPVTPYTPAERPATEAELRALYLASSYPAESREDSIRGALRDGRTVSVIRSWLQGEYPAQLSKPVGAVNPTTQGKTPPAIVKPAPLAPVKSAAINGAPAAAPKLPEWAPLAAAVAAALLLL